MFLVRLPRDRRPLLSARCRPKTMPTCTRFAPVGLATAAGSPLIPFAPPAGRVRITREMEAQQLAVEKEEEEEEEEEEGKMVGKRAGRGT